MTRLTPSKLRRDLRQVAKQVLPPIIVQALRSKVHGSIDQELPEWRYVSLSWPANQSDGSGWSAKAIAETEAAKWQDFLTATRGPGPLGVAHEATHVARTDSSAHNTIMAFAYVLALTARQTDRISILDWGGGLGHYYTLCRELLPGVAIDYHCRDFPALCEAGSKLNPDAHFYTRDDECFGRRYDLVMASGSLQYTQDWRDLLNRLAQAATSYLYVTRLPLVPSDSFVVCQRAHKYGYDTEYAGWFFNRDEFLDELKRANMELRREFLLQEHPVVQGAPAQAEWRALLCRPR